MLRRIKSSLFIDFENMPLAPDTIANWLAWLEDGMFDEQKRRRLLLKRVYWNAAHQKHAGAYEAQGFEVVTCERFHGLANSVDVRMAIDIIEATYTNTSIDEFILITRDTDFVPVLQRLDEKKKKSVFLVNEQQPNIHTTYRQHADVLIAVWEFRAARHYARPKAGLMGKLRGALRPDPAAKPTPAKPPEAAPKAAKPSPKAQKIDPIQKALDCVIRATSRTPNVLTAKAKIIKPLKVVPGFTVTGATCYLGFGSYRAMMQELAKLDPRIEIVDQSGGGIAVRYVPKAEPAASGVGGSEPVGRPAPAG